TDCCPPGAPYGSCVPGTHCRSRCSGGLSALGCGLDGKWIVGVGIFPCGGVTVCNDGTASTDCCTEGVSVGHVCLDSVSRCSPTGCQHGFKSYLDCDGNWEAEKGLYPCGADAGTTPSDAAASVSCKAAGGECVGPSTSCAIAMPSAECNPS